MKRTDHWGDILNIVLATVGFICVFILLPHSIIKIWNKRWDELENDDFKNKYGALYEGLRPNGRLIAKYHAVYMFRRISFVSTGLFCRIKDLEGIQWIILMYCVVFPSMIIVDLQINVSPEMNNFELYCEWTAGIAIILSCCFTEW